MPVIRLLAAVVLLPLCQVAAQQFPNVQAPTQNPITSAKVLLGKSLFWDEQVSSTGTVACGTCHMPEAGGTDARVRFPAAGVRGTVHPGPDGTFGTPDDRVASPGVPDNLAEGGYLASAWDLGPQVTARKSPSMINAVFHTQLFWDGRAGERFDDPITGALVLDGKAALESQAAGPPVSSVEMGHAGVSWTGIEARLATVRPLALASNLPAPLDAFVAGQTYPQLFQTAFGSPGVTAARVAMAIATYERTLVADDSRFDRWNGGQNPQWMSAQEVAGHQVFQGQGNCQGCHSPPFFSDGNFHRLGVRPYAEDPGRAGVTGQNGDRSKFKTPSLRNVSLHGHFMHNGGFATLTEVVEFYDRGGDFSPAQIAPLGLSTQQKADLVAFLHALTDERVANRLPPFDRPMLFTESNRVPQEYGHGTTGSNGFVPDAVAIEPPHLGNARFTVGVEDGLGGIFAALVLSLSEAAPGGYPAFGVQVFLGNDTMITHSLVALAGNGAGTGWGSLVVPLPSAPAFGGVPIHLQWFSLDAGGPQGITASEAIRFTLF